MDVVKLFKDAFIYPTKNWTVYLILGVLFAISGIADAYRSFQINSIIHVDSIIYNASQTSFSSDILVSTMYGQQMWHADLIYYIFSILAIIVFIFISGYALNIVRKTLALEEEIPEFEIKLNIIDGLKVLVLSIAYCIIPLIFIIGGIIAKLSILIFIGAILLILFSLLLIIATARLAETDNLIEAMNYINVFNKIGEIGWANFVIWIIVFILAMIGIMIVISIVTGLLGLLLGMIIALTGASLSIGVFIFSILILFLFYPFIQLFSSRALGLLYNEAK